MWRGSLLSALHHVMVPPLPILFATSGVDASLMLLFCDVEILRLSTAFSSCWPRETRFDARRLQAALDAL